mmetsp:Transcript_1197/g.3452  ORF Transcript_1197/g.3452 Transcript_1197/m.3452 type:complete len:261 (-) Transcript_1197:138-920(-)
MARSWATGTTRVGGGWHSRGFHLTRPMPACVRPWLASGKCGTRAWHWTTPRATAVAQVPSLSARRRWPTPSRGRWHAAPWPTTATAWCWATSSYRTRGTWARASSGRTCQACCQATCRATRARGSTCRGWVRRATQERTPCACRSTCPTAGWRDRIMVPCGTCTPRRGTSSTCWRRRRRRKRRRRSSTAHRRSSSTPMPWQRRWPPSSSSSSRWAPTPRLRTGVRRWRCHRRLWRWRARHRGCWSSLVSAVPLVTAAAVG